MTDANATATTDRYFVTDDDGVERETDAAGFQALERSCGFRPKPGCGPFATAGFSSGRRSGRIQTGGATAPKSGNAS